MKPTVLFVILMLGMWFSCQSPAAESENDQEQIQEDSLSATEPKEFKIKDPCDLITAEEMMQFTALDSSQKMTVESKVLTYPTCVYRWENILVKTKTFDLGEEVVLDLPAQVNIVLLRDKKTDDYQRAIKTYVDQIELSAIGEMAVWGDRLSQLTFFSEDHIFHVYVNVSETIDVNRQIAKDIAQKIVLSL